MEKPFRIYLDIDGVLISYLNLKDRHEDGRQNFQNRSVKALNNIIELSKAEICIVSTWGRGYWNDPNRPIDDFKEILINRGVNIEYGLTFGDPDHRADFVISEKKNGYIDYVIIDDEALEYELKINEIGYLNLIKCNPFRGLDEFDWLWFERNYGYKPK